MRVGVKLGVGDEYVDKDIARDWNGRSSSCKSQPPILHHLRI